MSVKAGFVLGYIFHSILC